jgi:hypothetical protein
MHSQVPERQLYASAQGVLLAACGHRGTRSELVTLDGELYCSACRNRKLQQEATSRAKCGHVKPMRDLVSSNLGLLCRPCYESETTAAAEHLRKTQEDLNKRHRYPHEHCAQCNSSEYLRRSSGGYYGYYLCRDCV